jgi:hypothetical protein
MEPNIYDEIKKRFIVAHETLLDWWQKGYDSMWFGYRAVRSCPLCEVSFCYVATIRARPDSHTKCSYSVSDLTSPTDRPVSPTPGEACTFCTQRCQSHLTFNPTQRGYVNLLRAEYHRRMAEYLKSLPPEAFGNMAAIQMQAVKIDRECLSEKWKK